MATLIRRELHCSTRCYEAVHCKRPRGEGLWWFVLSLPSGLHVHLSRQGRYGAVCAEVAVEARKLGAVEIDLAP